jgi:membrane-bound lytic murein transglycosylase D
MPLRCFSKTFACFNDTIVSPTSTFQSFIPANFGYDFVNIPLPNQMFSFYKEYSEKQGSELLHMKFWARPYFELYDKILSANGIPIALKYLSVIESHLQPNLQSWAGAVGPWQLMPDEARRFGLILNSQTDERTDFTKSTQVAAKLLKELYNEFGDWLLVIAAYNGGVTRVKQAIAKAGSNNFWDIQYYLPEETRNHVKKYIATHYVFENNGGITTLTAKEVQQYFNVLATPRSEVRPIDSSVCVIEVSGRYNSALICKHLQILPAYFNQLNPGFSTQLAAGKKYLMYLPANKKILFETMKQQILEQSISALLNDRPLLH